MEMLNLEQKEVVLGICEYLNLGSYSGIKEVITKVRETEIEDDFYIDGLWYECGSREIRIIRTSEIENIYYDSTVDLIKDCYNLDLPSFIEIDWDATVENCKVDGFGHHFSSWDGSEHETKNFYYFKN